MADDWLIVPNWERFQHYGKRDPIWIKLYSALNSDDEWLGLSLAERGLLATVWLEFCRSNGQVRLENIRRLCGSSARGSHIEALVNAGLLVVSASKPPPVRASASRAHEEAETEVKDKSVKAVASGRATEPPAAHAQNRGNIATGTLSEAHALRLVASLNDADATTRDIIIGYADTLPAAAFEHIREKVIEGNGNIRSPSGYARSELQRMVKERTYA